MKLATSFRAGIGVLGSLCLIACSEPSLLVLGEGERPLSHWQGKWLMINYWASWCAPCKTEIPELNRLHEFNDIDVLAVHYDGATGYALQKLATSMGIAFPSLEKDPYQDLGYERPNGLPMTVVLSPGGTVDAILYGPQQADDLRRRFPPVVHSSSSVSVNMPDQNQSTK